MCSSEQDRCRPAIENSVTPTQCGLLINRITNPRSRSEVIGVVRLPARIETCCQQRWIRISNLRSRQKLFVIANAKVESQVRRDVKVVLEKKREVLTVWVSSRTSRAGACKVL